MDLSVLPASFLYIPLGNNSVRANIQHSEAVDQWMKEYSESTRTSWIIKKNKKTLQRILCRKLFYCHHANIKKNILQKSKKTDCLANIDVIIKLTTENTKRADNYVKMGYPAIIKFECNHNHNVDSADVLYHLKSTPEIRAKFESYFNDGLSVAEAVRLHKKNLNGMSSIEMTNSAINPKYRSVSYWFDRWKLTKLDPHSGNVFKVAETNVLHSNRYSPNKMQSVFVNQPEVPEHETTVLPQFLSEVMEHDNLNIKTGLHEPETDDCTLLIVADENGLLGNKHTINKLPPKIMFETNGITDEAKQTDVLHLQCPETNENASRSEQTEHHENITALEAQSTENHVSNEAYCIEKIDTVIFNSTKDCNNSEKTEDFSIPTVNSNEECFQLPSKNQAIIELKQIDDCISFLKENDFLDWQKDIVTNKTTQRTELNDNKKGENFDMVNNENLQNEKCDCENIFDSVVIDTFDMLLSNDERKENKKEESRRKDDSIELMQDVFGTIEEIDASIQDKTSNEPILLLDFMKNFKHIFGEMTRESLEEFCLVKIVEAIARRSNLSKLEARLKSQMKSIKDLRKTLSIVTEQNKNLEIVVKNLTNEHKKRNFEMIGLVTVCRSVEVQVGPSSLHSKLDRSTNSQNSNIENNSNSQKTHQKNILNTLATSNVHMAKTDPKYQKTLQNVVSQKPNVSKQLAEKRLADQSIDLIDDEPPSKLLTMNNNQINFSPTLKIQNAVNHNSNSLILLNSQLLNVNSYNSNKQGLYQKLNSNSQQDTSPVSMTRSLNNIDTNIRLGIPIKPSETTTVVQSYNYSSYKRHLAPLPVAPSLRQTNPSWKWAPPRPELKISKVNNSIVISWIMEHEMDSRYEDIASYQIYAYQETSSPSSTELWKKIGDLTALPLPMACTLSHFIAGYKYYFAVRAIDVKQRIGAFSAPAYITLTNE